ncbi:hypothetical protein QQ008_24070 [Fulvivirgaceae bacterium BMA10]|uniref:Uncharacterized protein n=1 Tax=Splendidivirga corallicola TaxID=3051826 RepID=A0ABT8KUN4_9BACT|nr:hypothetical protein [Fulvivirgaceae bacterium BMA10]
MARKKKVKRSLPKVNPELEGFDIKIDSFGEIKSTFGIERINDFLNKQVDDKKLRDRDDLDFIREKKEAEANEEDIVDDFDGELLDPDDDPSFQS